MYDVVAALNAALVFMSGVFLWHFIDYEYKTRNEKKNNSLARFSRAIFFISAGLFTHSCLFLLEESHLMYHSTHDKLLAFPKGFFVAGLAFGFHALEIKWFRTIFIIALCLVMGVLAVRIVW